MSETRDAIVERWRRQAAAGRPLRGGPDGDFRIATNAARFGGVLGGMLPFGDANAIVLSLPSAPGPVLAGVCATDPLRLLDKFLEEIRAAGFSGVLNFPSVGLVDGIFRQNLEDSKLGYEREVGMMKAARGLGLVAAALAFSAADAARMAEAGADLVVAHPGLATRGPAGAKAAKSASRFAAELADAARSARGDVLALSYGAEAHPGTDGSFVI
jgi:predicted TIM-barrel enzyme